MYVTAEWKWELMGSTAKIIGMLPSVHQHKHCQLSKSPPRTVGSSIRATQNQGATRGTHGRNLPLSSIHAIMLGWTGLSHNPMNISFFPSGKQTKHSLSGWPSLVDTHSKILRRQHPWSSSVIDLE